MMILKTLEDPRIFQFQYIFRYIFQRVMYIYILKRISKKCFDIGMMVTGSPSTIHPDMLIQIDGVAVIYVVDMCKVAGDAISKKEIRRNRCIQERIIIKVHKMLAQSRDAVNVQFNGM